MGVFDHPTAWYGCEQAVAEFLASVDPIKTIVEIGVDHGYSLFKLAEMYPKAKVYGFDNFSYADGEHAKNWVNQYLSEYKNVTVAAWSSEQASFAWSTGHGKDDTTIDVLHIDADHAYDSVRADFNNWEQWVRPGGVILFHDTRSFPNDVGRFFRGLPGVKKEITSHHGLGAWYKPVLVQDYGGHDMTENS